MSRPWMPWYVADFIADTQHLDSSLTGAYMMLIGHYWQRGSLPDDDAALARIARMTPAEWRRARPTLRAFFCENWKHKRIDQELARSAEISSKRKAAADSRHSKSNANAQQLETQPQPQSQEERILEFRKAGEGKPKGPRHGATSASRGTTFIRYGTDDWEAYADDHRKAFGWVPEPNSDGGYWFKTAGAASLPPPKRLNG